MAASLTLNDRILTLTVDGVESSVDLSNIRGDIGVRGVQGSVNEEEVRKWISEAVANIPTIPSAEGVSY